MEIILLERVENLGQMGDVVKVKDGYARNYLLPQKKALRATRDNLKRFETERAQLEATNLERRKEAQAVAEKLDGLTIVLLRQASESTQLYGSVNARDIAAGIVEAGFTVDRRQVVLDRAIKTLGIHPVRVALHAEVAVTVNVNVARSLEEAEIQAAGRRAEAAEAADAEAESIVVDEFFEDAALAPSDDERESEDGAGEVAAEATAEATPDKDAGA